MSFADRVKGFLNPPEAAPIGLGLKEAGALEPVRSADWYERNGYHGIAAALMSGGGSASWSGERVGLISALNHSVVFACNRAVAEPVGFVPLALMQRTDKGRRNAFEHPMYTALHDSPNAEMTAMSFRETITSHALLQGNGYSQVVRRSGSGTAIELRTIMPNQMHVDRDRAHRLVYIIKSAGNSDTVYTVQRGKPLDILHLKNIGNNGIIGYSVLSQGRHSIGSGLAAERNVGRFFAAGGRVPYNLKLSQPFKSKQDGDEFRDDWERIYSDPHRAPLLPPWVEYQQTGLSMADQQMLEQRQFSIPEICRWFNVSPHLVGDLSRATFSNVEQLALDHVKFCLSAWFVRWEQELSRCVLTPEERAQGFYFKFNVNALLRGDFVSRVAGYSSALQNGWLNQDEVRDLEDRDPLPNGDGEAYHIQQNMQELPVDPAAAHLAAGAAAADKPAKPDKGRP